MMKFLAGIANPCFAMNEDQGHEHPITPHLKGCEEVRTLKEQAIEGQQLAQAAGKA